MSRPETFPQSEAGADISRRKAIRIADQNRIETAIMAGIGVSTLVEVYGSKTVEAAFSNPDFIESVDPAPVHQEGSENAA